MIFEISRASSSEGKPHPDAYKGTARWTNSYGPQECEAYFIEVSSLEELLKVGGNHGVIVDDNSWDDKTPHITIYDGYVE